MPRSRKIPATSALERAPDSSREYSYVCHVFA